MAAMPVLFDDDVFPEYHRFELRNPSADPGGDGCGGQVNGILGAAEPGKLVVQTGKHTGYVPLRIERHEAEPPPEPNWTEVVEASFTSVEDELAIDPNRAIRWSEGFFRVRMCAVHYHHEFDEEADEPERFLMQFWPAPPAPDRIVRQTSRYAASEHARAQATPPPPAP